MGLHLENLDWSIGAENAMRAAHQSGTVERVVLTSSMAAMHNSKDSSPKGAISPPLNGLLYTVDDWNCQTDVETSPYPHSKVYVITYLSLSASIWLQISCKD